MHFLLQHQTQLLFIASNIYPTTFFKFEFETNHTVFGISFSLPSTLPLLFLHGTNIFIKSTERQQNSLNSKNRKKITGYIVIELLKLNENKRQLAEKKEEKEAVSNEKQFDRVVKR